MLVSIITPAFNSSDYIAYTIESVINQTYENWEMIIVDDCSTDETVRIIKKYIHKDSRIKLLQLRENIGAASSRNVGLKQANGRFIAFLDSDDLWYSIKLEKQIAFMIKNNYAFTFTSYLPISEDGERKYRPIKVPSYIDYRKYLRNTIIGCLTVMIDKNKTGEFFMPPIRSSHDMALWLEIMKRGYPAFGLNQVLAKYRIVTESNTSRKWKAAKDVWMVYRRIENLSFIYGLLNFCFYILNAIKKRI